MSVCGLKSLLCLLVGMKFGYIKTFVSLPMNTVAHSLSIPCTIEAACAIIAKGKTRRIDVGRIDEQIFLESAGIGLEAALFPYLEEMKSFGVLATLRGVIRGLFTLFTFQKTKLKISFDEESFRSYQAIQV